MGERKETLVLAAAERAVREAPEPPRISNVDRVSQTPRQLDGIRRYQKRLAAEGRKPGRPLKVNPERVKALREKGKTTRQIMAATDLSRASVYRALDR